KQATPYRSREETSRTRGRITQTSCCRSQTDAASRPATVEKSGAAFKTEDAWAAVKLKSSTWCRISGSAAEKKRALFVFGKRPVPLPLLHAAHTASKRMFAPYASA